MEDSTKHRGVCVCCSFWLRVVLGVGDHALGELAYRSASRRGRATIPANYGPPLEEEHTKCHVAPIDATAVAAERPPEYPEHFCFATGCYCRPFPCGAGYRSLQYCLCLCSTALLLFTVRRRGAPNSPLRSSGHRAVVDYQGCCDFCCYD